MHQYLDALYYITVFGTNTDNRTKYPTRKVFGMQQRYNMAKGFPAVTTKKLAWQAVKGELLWFISGSSNVNDLKKIMKSDFTIWNANAEADYWQPKADFEGDLGRVYSRQWRDWLGPDGNSHDQLLKVIQDIISTKLDPTVPEARRLIVTAWNPAELDQMALPPCHMFYQFNVRGKYLDLQMYQRSCDMGLGVPFNIASYALLLHLVAQVTRLEPGHFVHTLGDAHIYHNHLPQIEEQLKRVPLALPKLILNKNVKNIDDFRMEDIQLIDYKYHPAIKMDMAI